MVGADPKDWSGCACTYLLLAARTFPLTRGVVFGGIKEVYVWVVKRWMQTKNKKERRSQKVLSLRETPLGPTGEKKRDESSAAVLPTRDLLAEGSNCVLMIQFIFTYIQSESDSDED